MGALAGPLQLVLRRSLPRPRDSQHSGLPCLGQGGTAVHLSLCPPPQDAGACVLCSGRWSPTPLGTRGAVASGAVAAPTGLGLTLLSLCLSCSARSFWKVLETDTPEIWEQGGNAFPASRFLFFQDAEAACIPHPRCPHRSALPGPLEASLASAWDRVPRCRTGPQGRGGHYSASSQLPGHRISLIPRCDWGGGGVKAP